jgi:PERQ amino acid-rich with GYF domain-containing protein
MKLQPANRLKIEEEEEEQHRHSGPTADTRNSLGQNTSQGSSPPTGNSPPGPELSVVDNDNVVPSSMNGSEGPTSLTVHSATHPIPAGGPLVQSNSTPLTTGSQAVANPASVEWSYLDPQGNVQGIARSLQPSSI